MDMKHFEKKSALALKDKNHGAREMCCKICDERFSTVSEMDKHLKTWMHDEIMKEFKASLNLY